ncbi:MAG: EamA family transporter [Microcella sp.]|uniref:DMT family transporter n=1 Tax=Microcella sp. TaxID=1913979 RepID=UPI003314E635
MAAAIGALVLASVLWGTTGTAATFLTGGVSPLAIGATTMALGGTLLFTTSSRSSLAVVRDRAIRRWLLLAALGMVVYPLTFYAAMDLAGVAIGNVVSLGSGPLFAALLEWRVDRHRLTLRWMLSTAVALGGVALLVGGGHGAESVVNPATVPLGVVLGLAAGAGYALFTYSAGVIVRAVHGGRATMGAVFGLAAIPLSVVMLITAAPLLATVANAGIAAYLALGPMFLAYVLFARSLRALRSSTVTVVTLLEPFVATLLAVAVVGERLEPAGWVGLALILLGVTVLSTARHPRQMA